MSAHSLASLGARHPIHNWEYADTAARTGASGFTSSDIGKVAKQTDENSYWLLIATTPTWAEITPSTDSPGGLIVNVQKNTSGTINPGQAVYIAGFDVGAEVTTVELANASGASTMPALGIARDTITDTVTGAVLIVGTLDNQVTGGYSAGDALYVSETAGGLTDTKPDGTALIQKIGIVARSHPTQGVIEVFGAGRTNDIPNIAQDKLWMGDSNGVPQETSRSGIDNTAIHKNVAGEIASVGSVTVASDDKVLVEDTSNSDAKGRVTAGAVAASGPPQSHAHSSHTGIGTDDHHPQTHTHASHTGIGTDDHHPQSHSHASHTGIGTDDHHAQLHASSHVPSAGDPLATAVAGAVQIGDSAAQGTADSFSRSDHKHSVAAPGAPVDVTKAAAAAGTSTSPARADHKHNITTAAPAATGVATTPSEGTATTLARSDHAHQSNTTPANVTKAAAAVGTSGEPARADHKHDVTTAAPTATGVGTTSSEGTATTLARSDHRHQSNTTPANVTKAAAVIGTSGEPARADHKHDVATAAAVAVGTANAEGTSTSLARADHTHEVTGLKVSGEQQGDILYRGASAWVRLAPGSQGQVLKTNGAAAPAWVWIQGVIGLTRSGTLAVGTNRTAVWRATQNLEILKVRITVKTPPTGQAIVVDVNKGGTTIFTTQANRPQIAASAYSGDSGTPDVTTLADGNEITVDIDQVGSGTAGADLTVEILCRLKF